MAIMRLVQRRHSGAHYRTVNAVEVEGPDDDDEEVVDLVDEVNGHRPCQKKERETDKDVDGLLGDFTGAPRTKTTYGQKRSALIAAHNRLVAKNKRFTEAELLSGAAASAGVIRQTMRNFFKALGGTDQAMLMNQTEMIPTCGLHRCRRKRFRRLNLLCIVASLVSQRSLGSENGRPARR